MSGLTRILFLAGEGGISSRHPLVHKGYSGDADPGYQYCSRLLEMAATTTSKLLVLSVLEGCSGDITAEISR